MIRREAPPTLAGLPVSKVGLTSGEESLVKRTGIFFTYFQGERLRDFPRALAGILDKENVS